MSRYLVDGIRGDLAMGLRVGLVAPNRAEARALFNSVAEAMKDEASRISKANGAERISSNEGGEFCVFALNSTGMRGIVLDVLVVANRGALSVERFEQLMEDVIPVMATRPNFELITA